MKKQLKPHTRDKPLFFLSIFLCLSVIGITIGYSALNANLTLSGDAYVRVDEDIRITDLKMVETTNGTYETYNSQYSKDTTSTFVTFPNLNSTITYEGTITNKSDYTYLVEDLIEESKTNNQIHYTFTELTIGDPIKPHTTKKFTIQITSKSMNQIIDLVIKYKFQKVDQTVFVYDYTGSSQEFIIPYTGTYKIELWGAQGGSSKYNNDGTGNTVLGGNGGYTSGIISLSAGTNLFVYVGGKGLDGISGTDVAGGYNGGGSGGYVYQGSGSGGGATDIRLISGIWSDFNSLNSRIMVAGGGSGASNHVNAVSGGSGGGLIGQDGKLNIDSPAHTLATGGTQTSGGTPGGTVGIGEPGKFGIGGNPSSFHGSGGGAGYYGGGAAGYTMGGVSSGAGGSSFISGHTGCVAIISETNQTPKSGCTTGTNNYNCSIHYSNYQFKNTVMIDGAGYKWSNVKESYAGMPTHDGTSIMTGNSGNGYVKITFIIDK